MALIRAALPRQDAMTAGSRFHDSTVPLAIDLTSLKFYSAPS